MHRLSGVGFFLTVLAAAACWGQAQPAPPTKGAAPARVAAEVGMRSFTGHTDGISCLAFSPDGKLLASGGGDRSIIIWDVASGTIVRRLEGHRGAITGLAFSPDGSRLVSAAAEPFADVWNTATWSIEHLCEVGAGASFVAFLADSQSFATADGTAVNIWDAATAAHRRTLTLPANISAIYAAPDGELITGDTGGDLIAWDPATGEKKAEHHRPKAAVDKDKAINFVVAIAGGPAGHVYVNDRDGVWDWDRKADQLSYCVKQLFGIAGLVAKGKYMVGGTQKSVWIREPDPAGIAVEFRMGYVIHTVAASPTGDVWAYAGRGEWKAAFQWRRGPAADIRVLNASSLAHAFEIAHQDAAAAQKKTPGRPLDRSSIGGTDAAIAGWDEAASTEPAEHDALP